MTRKKDIEVEITDSEKETAETNPADDTNGDNIAKEIDSVTEEERLKDRINELEDRLLRNAAEFDNYKKRQARLYEDMVRTANDRVLSDLLEIVDNLERAVEHAAADNNDANDGLRRGAELILTQMKDLLTRYEVTPIEALGKPFDPNLHEALMQVQSDEYDEGIVAMEINKGYKRGDRVIRHARVGVSTGPAQAE